MIHKYTTEARPAPKNVIWEVNRNGQRYITERPLYKSKKLEQEWLTQSFLVEGNLLYGQEIEFYFDEEGRWWAAPELCSQKLLQFFIANPTRYFRVINHKVKKVKEIITVLQEVEQELETKDPAKVLEQYRKLENVYIDFYSYHFTTFIVYDELVLRFRKILEEFLEKRELNLYLTEFLQAEITKEAINVGAVEESLEQSRDLFYSKSKPIIFYREPKLFFVSAMDNKVMSRVQERKPELLEEFVSLRLITPLAIQLSEEAQYIESKMLCPITKIVLEKIKEMLVGAGKFISTEDLREFSSMEIVRKMREVMAL